MEICEIDYKKLLQIFAEWSFCRTLEIFKNSAKILSGSGAFLASIFLHFFGIFLGLLPLPFSSSDCAAAHRIAPSESPDK